MRNIRSGISSLAYGTYSIASGTFNIAPVTDLEKTLILEFWILRNIFNNHKLRNQINTPM
jgi:hypothetical protein